MSLGRPPLPGLRQGSQVSQRVKLFSLGHPCGSWLCCRSTTILMCHKLLLQLLSSLLKVGHAHPLQTPPPPAPQVTPSVYAVKIVPCGYTPQDRPLKPLQLRRFPRPSLPSLNECYFSAAVSSSYASHLRAHTVACRL